jgi:hypothetical protein
MSSSQAWRDDTPLRDCLEQLDRKAGLQIGATEMSQMCQLMGVNGVNFVRDLRSMPSSSLEILGMPRVLIECVVKSVTNPNQGRSAFPLANELQQGLLNPSSSSSSSSSSSIVHRQQQQNNPFFSSPSSSSFIDSGQPKNPSSSSFDPFNSNSGGEMRGGEMKHSRNQCSTCRDSLIEGYHVTLGGCRHSFCFPCMNKYVVGLIERKAVAGMTCPVNRCAQELGENDIRPCLMPKEYEQYIQCTLDGFIKADKNTFECPTEGCTEIISVQNADSQYVDLSKKITEQDDNGRVLSREAYIHFQQKRIRCRKCRGNFCAECKRVPYHKGYTCKAYEEYLQSRKCRFCAETLTDSNSYTGIPGIDSCKEEECVERAKICCTKINPCGCPCNGVAGELECLPCLKCELNEADEYCTICYCEALSAAPCIKLGSCNHIYHYDCVRQKINAGYSGARINFNFLECGFDKKVMEHPAIQALMEPHLRLKKVITTKAMERLKYENRQNDKEIVSNVGGPYYKNPELFALHLFLFFTCFKCKSPYFAGGYQCQGNEADFDPADLVCGACQPKSENVRECKTHGTEWIGFKCKFCCQIANFFCWNNTHFCNNCHVPGVWQKKTYKLTGKNKLRLWEYDQCPDMKRQMDAVQKNNPRMRNKDQLEALMLKLRCDPKQCPLKASHPPNGTEFGLGCTMCIDKAEESSGFNVEAEDKKASKANKSNKNKKAKNNDGNAQLTLAAKLGRKPRTFKFSHKLNCKNGIVYYIGTNGGSSNFSTPTPVNIKVTSSGLRADSVPLQNMVNRVNCNIVTNGSSPAWIIIDFRSLRIAPTHYSLRNAASGKNSLRNWRISGSADGKQANWDTLSDHKQDANLHQPNQTQTWPIPEYSVKAPYRYFCLISTGPGSDPNSDTLALGGFEIYGTVYANN